MLLSLKQPVYERWHFISIRNVHKLMLKIYPTGIQEITQQPAREDAILTMVTDLKLSFAFVP